MNTLFTLFGWMFILLAAIFALGLLPAFAGRFYPDAPGFSGRLAAPVIFIGLALACFLGYAVPALVGVVAVGVIQIAVNRRKQQRS